MRIGIFLGDGGAPDPLEIPTYPRHPLLMAQQALTTQLATRGRLTLGIGLSHRPVIERMFGCSFERPAPSPG